MKMNVIFLTFFFFSSFAQASSLVEPYMGPSITGGGDLTIGSDKTILEFSTFKKGIRVGYEHLIAIFGVDYSFSSFHVTKNELDREEVSRSNFGLFAGVDIPLAFRAWMTWIMRSKLEGRVDQAIFAHDAMFRGQGQSIGVGFSPLPFVSFNIEYISVKYGDYQRNGVDVENYNDELNLHEIFLSISVPLNF